MTVEVKELQDSVRRVVDGVGLAANENALWDQVVELGWLLVAVPEELGGLGAGIQGACAMHAELGRGLSCAPYLPAMMAIDAITQSELDDRDNWIERTVAGELVTAPLAECEVSQNGSSLNGRVTGVQSADWASHVLVWTADKKAVMLVALDQPGVERLARPTWDQTRRLFDIGIADLALKDQIVLARGDVAGSLISRLLAVRDFALAADGIGAASALLEQTIEHLQTRVQFKRPLAMFQSLKHRCADIKASIAGSEAMLADGVRQASAALDSQDARLRAISAKLSSSIMFARAAEDSLQLHGGIGMADEHPCHLFLKRALLGEHLSGSANGYALELAQSLIASVK